MKLGFIHKRLKSKIKNESGMTVIELLVATTVSLILLTIIFQFFVTQTQNFNEGRMNAEMMQELRWASIYIAERLKLAGNGVPPTSGFKVLDNFDGGATLSDSVCVTASFKSLVMETTQKMGSNGVQIKVASKEGIEDYDLIVISYPPEGWQEIFMSTKGASDLHIYHAEYPPWNEDDKLEHAYPLGSIVSVVSQFSFFVEVDDEGRSNLMVQTQGPYGPQILAGDIDNFQVRFKLRNNSWIDEPDDLSDIRMLEITLQAMTPDPIQGYIHPVYADAHKRIELKTIVIPKNIVMVSN